MRGEREQFVQAGIVIGAAMQLDAQPKALGEAFAEPGNLLVPMVVRQPDRQQAGERLLQVFAQQPVVALVGLSPAAGDEATEVLVALQVLRQEDQLGPLFEADFAADDQLYLMLPRRLPGPHDTGQAAFVGDRQGPIAQARCTGEEFRGAGGAALETEVGQAMQFGVGAHANQPCSHSGPSLPTSR